MSGLGWEVADTPAPKEEPRIATNLLLRAGLLLAPDAESRAFLSAVVTKARKAAPRVSEADEREISKHLSLYLAHGMAHGDWQR